MRPFTLALAALALAPVAAQAMPARSGPGGAYADSAAAELFGGSNHCRDSRGRVVACQAPTAPAGASARCRDGSYSMSRDRRTACAADGGVAQWLR